jgi:SufS family cysteine desulfurase
MGQGPLINPPQVATEPQSSQGVHDAPPEKSSANQPAAFDAHAVRGDFPALHQKVYSKQLVWLDNAATTQKPQSVIDALTHYYAHDNSNIHRGDHLLADRAAAAHENARHKVQIFLGANSPAEIIYTRGSTEAINLVAQAYGRSVVGPGDEVLVTQLEHHSNIVPWQFLCQEKGATLRVIPIDDQGQVILDEYEQLLGPRTRIVAVAQVSNVLGTVLPIGMMTQMAHRHGARVLVDGAQGAPHLPVNVQALDADFYVFSGHKLFAPTGIGILYGKREILEAMPPWQGGGSMIQSVTFEKTTFSPPPAKFEAGTPHIAGAVGLGAAVDYINRYGLESIAAYEEELMAYATAALDTIPGLRQIGTTPGKVGALAFVISGTDTKEVGRFLDSEGIAVRSGHHCAQPTLQRYGLTSSVRASISLYNTVEDIDALMAALRNIKRTT